MGFFFTQPQIHIHHRSALAALRPKLERKMFKVHHSRLELCVSEGWPQRLRCSGQGCWILRLAELLAEHETIIMELKLPAASWVRICGYFYALPTP